MSRYDQIGTTYRETRRPDPRIAAQIEQALGDATSVVNVGAGAGSYEPPHRQVVAIEPSRTMIGQRPAGAAPAIQGVAEHLPVATGSVDAATAFLTVHHWSDQPAGLRELARVARRVVVILTYLEVDLEPAARWVTREYFPGIEARDAHLFPPLGAFEQALGPVETAPLLVPRDCTDGFLHAYWARPEAYLDPVVRAGMSGFHLLPASELDQGVERLRADLASGAWDARWGALRERDSLDVGLRLVIARLAGA